jgi:hypothetical protein
MIVDTADPEAGEYLPCIPGFGFCSGVDKVGHAAKEGRQIGW